MAQDIESESDVGSDSVSSLFYLYTVNSERSKCAIWLRPHINDIKLKMELHTGSKFQ